MPRKKSKSNLPIDSLKHKDKRTNIPTEELRDFVADDEAKPRTMLYPRDPSLDPQLVWKGKDEMDRTDLAVSVVPVYIQEKIYPQAIIDALPRLEQPSENQPSLFADFNGGPADFEQKVEFYQHDQNWTNRMILGDSLLVMTSLAEKEGLKGKVQTIYIDPPYGIKFGSNWQVSTRKRDVKDGKAEDTVRQPEQIKAFRDTWKLGIHSYLAYLRERFVVARELLTETGSIFVQIGDENVHMVRCLLDEVIGSENFVGEISFKKTGYQASSLLPSNCDFVLWYAKNREQVKYRQLHISKFESAAFIGQDLWIEMPDGKRRRVKPEEAEKLDMLPEGTRLFRHKLAESAGASSTSQPFVFEDRKFLPKEGKHWSTTIEGMQRLALAKRWLLIGNSLRYVNYIDDFPVTPLTTNWTDTVVSGFSDPQLYVVQTATKVIQRCLLMTTDPGDLVLDPTCGSGTTAYVAEQWGRRWITIDTSRVALALARTRLMTAKHPYYILADSPDGIRKEAELTGKIPADSRTEGDIRRGFVYKRVPHVTLKSIANNPDIKVGMTREQIDAAIARHAESETLYDQPYEDNKRVRVCGPFSVESLSPHRILSTDVDIPRTQSAESTRNGGGRFEAMILENLKAAGVKTTKKGEGIKFDQLDSYAGTWIQGEGEFTDKDGKRQRVAVCIGPEHGSVSPQLIKEAAKEAVQGIGFDILVICGFAFDPHCSEETTRYGKLNVMIARMNPDLAMGDELLKKTGSGNLFMVFGEPDIIIHPVGAAPRGRPEKGQAPLNQICVEIRGVDVYDPTTGQVRSNSTEDIACWFIDTNYNGESFFVRRAYFCGGDQPYDKLKRALRTDVDESAWSALYSTTSRPFSIPETGKIAIKVINHYGDEVLKVFAL